MRKPWSISTTVRNPERIRDFLKILKELEGEIWNRENQRKFQILLIQNKLYGFGSQQFYNGLSKKHLGLMNNPDKISFKEAEEILDSKNYTGGGDMRGRQSFNPLEKMGLVFLDENNKVCISAVGEYFLKKDYDLGEVFFRCFIKWQLPNFDSKDFKKEDGFSIKPFVGALLLIDKVNKKWKSEGERPVGISRKEFSLFVPTLIDYEKIESYADEIIKLRKIKKNAKDKKKFLQKYGYDFVKNFLQTDSKKDIDKTIKNLSEYADNIIRYFRLTRFIQIRGNGYYIDLEQRRNIEIDLLFKSDSAEPFEFEDRKEYLDYLLDISQPILPWDNVKTLQEIAKKILNEILILEKQSGKKLLKQKDYTKLKINELKKYIEELRLYRRRLQEEIEHTKSQDIPNIEEYIDVLKNKIYQMDGRALVLEKYVSLGLNALNDAIRIKPNYPVGDDNEPTNTAPGGMSDIECFYEEYNSVCEVTLLKDRSQWFNEGQPVMRHLREFEDTNSNKEAFCLFVAPSLHQDTIETFWNSVYGLGYRGKKQKIVPLTLNQFVKILEILLKLKQKNIKFTRKNLVSLYNSILNIQGITDSDKWIESIPTKLSNWEESLVNGIGTK